MFYSVLLTKFFYISVLELLSIIKNQAPRKPESTDDIGFKEFYYFISYDT